MRYGIKASAVVMGAAAFLIDLLYLRVYEQHALLGVRRIMERVILNFRAAY